jgi:hypothetical protein
MNGGRTNKQALVRVVCRNVGNTLVDPIERGGGWRRRRETLQAASCRRSGRPSSCSPSPTTPAPTRSGSASNTKPPQ